MRAFRAAWLRGGTSKGLFVQPGDLPPAGPARDALLLSALGSPDATGLQLNGMGCGISSTSKVAVVSRSERPGYDVDYLFGQVEIQRRHISWQGSCGNLAAGVGIFALAEGLVASCADEGRALPVRVWQANQGYGMVVHVPRAAGVPQLASALLPDADADLMALAGVPGREPAVYVELLAPHGGRPLLPTGRVVDALRLPGGGTVEATLVAAGNPTVIVPAEAAGLRGTELPADMDYASLLPLVEDLRAQGARAMGVELSDQPRVAFVAPPEEYATSAQERVSSSACHLLSRISTPGRMHHAHTGTGSIALACAAAVEGSVPWRCMSDALRPARGDALRIGHPGGVMEVRADVRRDDQRGWHAIGAGFDRTARYLMQGLAFAPTPSRAP